jgi:RHS repeat-associated protein
MDRSTWGRTAPRPGSTATTNVRFAGQLEDEETGLFYNRYRYYDPEAGRYIGPDPAGVEAGFNLYRYGPNPVGWVDALGLETAPHTMYVKGGNKDGSHPGFRSTDMLNASNRQTGEYKSGKGLCPPELKNLTDPISGGADGPKDGPGQHTEQKFCYDLLEAHEKAGNNKGRAMKQPYTLNGTYPPCPNCHAAMMRTAKETGADITYNWGGNSVTYQGGTGNPTNVQGTNANSLMGAYSGIQLSDGGRNRAGTTPGEYWGATGISGGAHNAYDNMMRSEGHTK